MITLHNNYVTMKSFPAPSVLIYNNACNLHSYCLNGEPAFFKQSWMVVDQFHWPNHTGRILTDPYYADYKVNIKHTGCSFGYKLDAHPQFHHINTQVVEQTNADMKRTKSSLSYMNAKNFIAHMKLFLWYRSIQKEKKL